MASDPSQISHDEVCKAITKATGGRLEVKPFVGGSIVPAYKELDALNDNVLQLCYTCPMNNLDKFKAAGCEVYRLPQEVDVAKAADEFYGAAYDSMK